ncbi:hypothetical protein WH221_05900 [Chryseobacterium culicis]|nr:hypothetical protein [Chryseobacterium culicis]
MEFKSFLKASNIEEEGVEFASMEAENNALITKVNLPDNHDIKCIKCKGNQNVKLATIAPASENRDDYPYFLCENCRKTSFKLKIFR